MGQSETHQGATVQEVPVFAMELHEEWGAVAKVMERINTGDWEAAVPTVEEIAVHGTVLRAFEAVHQDDILAEIDIVRTVLDQVGVRLNPGGDYPDLAEGLANAVSLACHYALWHERIKLNLPKDRDDTPEQLRNAKALGILNDPDHEAHDTLVACVDACRAAETFVPGDARREKAVAGKGGDDD